MVSILKAESYREGRWLNGLGLSWDIAAAPPDAGGQAFEWRMALARIDSSVAFSHYQNVERIFMLIEGHGLDLVFDDRKVLKINLPFVPHEFPGDAKTECVVNNGPCQALNLFIRRGTWKGSVNVLGPDSNLTIISAHTTLAFVLQGCFTLAEGGTLNSGDALQLSPGESAHFNPQSEAALVYVAALTPVR